MDADPDPATNLVLQIGLLVVLILINAFFAMSEMAVVSLNDSKIKKMAEEGHKQAKKVMKLTESSSSFLSTIQIGVTLAGFLASASASQSFVTLFGDFLIARLGTFGATNATVINGVAVVIITVITSYFTLVFGELVPKRLAIQNPEKVSFRVAGLLLFIRACLKPFVAFLTVSTNLVVRLFGIDPNHEPEEVTEEEILMMVDVGEEKGVIEESQKEMINNIFEFDDNPVEDIMTHRTDILAVEVTDPLEEAAKIAIEEGFSRIPVYEDDLDNIVGVIYAKDLLPFVGQALPAQTTVSETMRSVYYVPESKKCGDLFTEMTEKHIQMAIVVDEYGGTAGLVTMEDLIESILGNIQDEYDDEEEDIEQVSENVFTIDGVTDIEEVSEKLGRTLPEGDYDTLGGMIMSLLGYIPTEDETPTVEVNYTTFTVLSVEDRRIDKVRVEKLPIPDEEEESEE
ncbi:MAG: HlyC/CorC family transporter [Clostridia bacterium]|nr:HlyC/CorC family transporter [Clostridia bacterium]